MSKEQLRLVQQVRQLRKAQGRKPRFKNKPLAAAVAAPDLDQTSSKGQNEQFDFWPDSEV